MTAAMSVFETCTPIAVLPMLGLQDIMFQSTAPRRSGGDKGITTGSCLPPCFFIPHLSSFTDKHRLWGFSPLPPASATFTSASKRAPPFPEGPPPSRPRSPPLRPRSSSPTTRPRFPSPPPSENGNATNRPLRCPSLLSAYSVVSEDLNDASDQGSVHDSSSPSK